MIRALSTLIKNNVVKYKNGVIKGNKNIMDLFDLSIYEDIEDFINENKKQTANKIVGRILKKNIVFCKNCDNGILMFSEGAYCNKCNVKFKKKYYNITLSQQQIAILNYTNQILFFKNKRPMILYAKRINNKYMYTTTS